MLYVTTFTFTILLYSTFQTATGQKFGNLVMRNDIFLESKEKASVLCVYGFSLSHQPRREVREGSYRTVSPFQVNHSDMNHNMRRAYEAVRFAVI